MLTEKDREAIERCEKLTENEPDFIFSFSRCLRHEGFYDYKVFEAIRYILGIDL